MKQDTYARPIAGLIPAIAVMLGLAAAGARAEQLPLWEAGMGAAALSFPDYRGPNERQFWLLPFPYIIYPGDGKSRRQALLVNRGHSPCIWIQCAN